MESENMKGELWQECECGEEPVCAQCFLCTKHCTCNQKPIEKTATKK